jgi:WD40 repeat protein
MDAEAYTCNFVDCGLILEDPISLSCGNNLCKRHLDQFENKFKCDFCHKMHPIPEGGFLVNQAFDKIIQKYIQLDPIKDEIKKSFDILNKSINDCENLNQDEYISDYFGNLYQKVNLCKEDLIKEINERSNELIKELKDKEIKCKTNQIKLENIDLFELKNDFVPSWKLRLRHPDLNQEQSKQLLNDINKNNQKIQDQLTRNKNDLLLGESIEFEKCINNHFVGKLRVYLNDNSLSKNCGQLIKSFNQHTSLPRSIQVDENSKILISASEDQTIKIWNLETGECLKTLSDHTDWVTSILFIPNNKFISGSEDKSIKIWDLNSYTCLKTLANEYSIYSLCLLPNNQIACGCVNGSINVWNLDNSRKIKTFKAHNDWIPHLVLFDKTKLISCAAENDNKIKIWSINKFKCLQVFDGHTDIVYYLELTSDGNLLSCSDDKTVKLWQIKTGKDLKSIQFDDQVCCVKILNKDLIAVALLNGEILIYNFNQEHYVKSLSTSGSSFASRLLLLSNGNLLSASKNGNIAQIEMLNMNDS